MYCCLSEPTDRLPDPAPESPDLVVARGSGVEFFVAYRSHCSRFRRDPQSREELVKAGLPSALVLEPSEERLESLSIGELRKAWDRSFARTNQPT